MSKLVVEQFLTLVKRSGLVAAEELTSAVANWRQAHPDAQTNTTSCAQYLVEAGLLTPWQAHKLLDGRHRGFFLGRYKLLDHLGSGGMSSVYLGEHLLMQRRVAIKVLPQHRVADAAYLAQFHLEAQAVAALDHQNIVRAYDVGSEGNVHFLVMEYVEGCDLAALVEQHGPLDPHTAAYYTAQVALGLEHAHSSGLVHRDIKPANLLVDLTGTVKILDMGLAKFIGEKRSEPLLVHDEHVLGTAQYLAPEQAVNSQTVDRRADIYALGGTLYFLLTGHPPFESDIAAELIAAHKQQTPASILAERPETPAELVTICSRMMEKATSERFQNAREVLDALCGWLADERAAGRLTGSKESEFVQRFGHLEELNRQRNDPERGSGNAETVAWADDSALAETNVILGDTDGIETSAAQRAAKSSGALHRSAKPTTGEPRPQEPTRRAASAEQPTEHLIPPPPPTPPVVPPPRVASVAPAKVVSVDPQSSSEAPIDVGVSRDDSALAPPLLVKRARASKRASSTLWLFSALLSAFIIAAALLALIATLS